MFAFRNKFFLTCILLSGFNSAIAQRWDFGAWFGGADYFGDLNTLTSFRFVNPAGGVLARYNVDDRVSFRANIGAGHVWADDQYSNAYVERIRNLGFSSNIFEASVQAEFNFIPFSNVFLSTYSEKQRYSPYILLGFSTFYFNPKVDYNGTTVELQPLGTEGQDLQGYTDLKKYKRVSTALLIGGGIKYRIGRNFGLQFEAGVRKTSTDYLDDVSGNYVDPIVMLFERGEMTAFLADPSVAVLSEPIGVAGKMRGDNTKSDDYMFFGIGFIYTIKPYKCPYQ
ncbi:MAG: DUF6089 family protein [Chitinophagales bacterium]|nr:DUF6089 family protein [Chitinophagales bacterium]